KHSAPEVPHRQKRTIRRRSTVRYPAPENVDGRVRPHRGVFILIIEFMFVFVSGSTPGARRSSISGFSFRLDERAEKRKEVS
ncbi:hypothetical protein GW17_00047788, partial [Ensete ventricosum]